MGGGRGRRDRRPRPARAGHRPGPRRPGPCARDRSTSSVPRAGIEARLVPAAGFPLTLLPGRGIARRLTLDNVGAVLGLIAAVVRALMLVGTRRPRVVVPVGGYASVPCVLAASCCACPSCCTSRTRCRAWPTAWRPASPRPPPSRPWHAAAARGDTGNPVRAEIARRRPLPGGSGRGARMPSAFPTAVGGRRVRRLARRPAHQHRRAGPGRGAVAGRADVAVRHVVGPRLGRVRGAFDRGRRAALPRRRVRGPHAAALRRRRRGRVPAGATTVAELAAVGRARRPRAAARRALATTRPPTPRRSSTAGAACWCPTPSCTAERLAHELDALLADPVRLEAMGRPPPRWPGPTPPSGSPTWWSAMPDLDLSSPRTVHVVGVGGAGMSAIATVLAAMGHTVSGSDLKDSAGARPAARRGRRRRRRPRAGERAGRRRRSWPSRRRSRTATPRCVEAAARGIPVLRRAEVLAAIARTRRTVAVAGTHGKTTTSSMLALVLVEAGLRPVVHHRRRGQRDRHRRGVGRRRAGSWSRPTRATARSSSSAPRPPSSPTSSPTTSSTTAASTRCVDAFDRFLAAAPGPVVVCADDAGAAAWPRPRRRRHLRHVGRRRLPHGRRRSPGAPARRFAVEHDGRRASARSCCPVPGLHNARNAARRRRHGAGARRAVRRRRRGRWPATRGVARRFQFRGERDGVTFVDDYAHLPTEVRGRPGRGQDGGWRRVVCVFQPHRYSRTGVAVARLRRRLRRRRRARRHRHLRRRRGAAARRHRASWSSTPCSTPIPGTRLAYLPSRRRPGRLPAPGAAPRRPVPHPRRRRPDVAARRAAR